MFKPRSKFLSGGSAAPFALRLCWAVFATYAFLVFSIANAQSDQDLVSAVQSALAHDPALAGAEITVDSLAARVMLTGSARTPALRDEAERTAGSVAGVREVIDEIRAEPAPSAADKARDAQAQTALQQMTAADAGSAPTMRGHVLGGVAYVLAIVGSRSEGDALQAAIGGLPGINAVVAHLVSTTPDAPQQAQAAIPPTDADATPPAALPAAADDLALNQASVPARPSPSLDSSGAKPAISRIYTAQLASGSNEAEIQKKWDKLRRANADLLNSYTPAIVAVDLGAKGRHYRLRLGPFADKPSAESLCAALAARSIGCMVMGRAAQPDGS
jgi:osmotically-inducible protein OsmY